jgi:positive regulator of sigma E activity
MKEIGTVESVEGREVMVRLKRHGACLGCRACSLSSSGDMIIKAKSLDELRPGDQVTIEIGAEKIVKAILLIYLFPALAFLFGVIVGFYGLPRVGVDRHIELISVVVGFFCMVLAYSVASNYGLRKREEYKATAATIKS